MESIKSLTKLQVSNIFYYTDRFKEQQKNRNFIINGNIIDYGNKFLCNAFFESSTRTSMSFENAMLKLGGKVISFDSTSSSLKKGESFDDTMKTIQEFCDIIVLRHPNQENIYKASKLCKIPIINGGNGAGEHPTQALLDLYTIRENYNINKQFHICFIGDIKYSRTIHSLLELLVKMEIKCTITFHCYSNCFPEKSYIDYLKEHFGDNNVQFTDNIEENIQKYDIFYCTRNQIERHNSYNHDTNNHIFNNFKNKNVDLDVSKWQINKFKLEKMKSTAIILHPLPRNNEIHVNVDNDRRAKYFDQVKNGVYIRMAILHNIFNNSMTLSNDLAL